MSSPDLLPLGDRIPVCPLPPGLLRHARPDAGGCSLLPGLAFII